MTKSISIVICIFVLLLFLTSCNTLPHDETSPKSKDSVDSSFFSIDIPQINKTNQQIIYTKYGMFGNEFGKSQVLLICDNTIGEKELTSNTYLAVIAGNDEILTFEFGKIEKIAVTQDIANMIVLEDIDGDSIDEIIVNFRATGNGATTAYVLRINGNSIELLFDLNNERSLSQTENFVPTFNCEFLEKCKLRIYNDNIGFSEEIDISHYSKDFFNDKGVGKSDTKWVYCEYVDSCGFDKKRNEVFSECNIKLNSGIVGRIKMIYSYDSSEDAILLTNAEIVRTE